MKIMTLNINRFCGIKRERNLNEIYSNIIKFNNMVRKLLDKDDIMIVQEFPYQNKDGFTPEYEFAKDLIQEEFQIIWPNHLIDSYLCTIAIVRPESRWDHISEKEEKVIYDKDYSYGNRIIEARYGEVDLSMLGLHMSADIKI